MHKKQVKKKPRVFVSGCFDTLHAGHIAFIGEAARHGTLHIGIGSDATIEALKGRKTIYTQEERRYMLKALKMVSEVTINSGSGPLDFLPDLATIDPDILFVNEDGNNPEKEALCQKLGIRYLVSRRTPAAGLPPRSTTQIRQSSHIPFRIDLAGGWLDQPYVSKHHAGAVITIAIEPDHPFNNRSGMATSTRAKAIELWSSDLPPGDREKLARILFCYENPPGSAYISGSQDALGIVMPGINHHWYDPGNYWPTRTISRTDTSLLQWLESHLFLFPLKPRVGDLHVLQKTRITPTRARRLSEAADALWRAVETRDLPALGAAMTRSFEAQVSMFPLMMNDSIQSTINHHRDGAIGWKLSGAGGGGYLVLVAQHQPADTLKIRIRRENQP